MQQGRLSLTDTIAKRLPSLPAAWGKVTLAQALQHTSGLPDFAPTDAARRLALTRKPATPEQLLSFVAKRPLAFRPGTRYEYSNTDNIVVALFAQAATGLSYERLLSELVLDPLSMRSTSMLFGYRMIAPYVHGYSNNGTGPRADESDMLNGTLTWASGGIVSTPPDLTTFIRAYVGGRLIAGATRHAQLSFRPGSSSPPGPGTNAVGLAVFRYRTACGTVYGHTGNTAGYTTVIAATADGSRSAVLEFSTQLSTRSGSAAAFRMFRSAEERAVCAALA